MKKTTGKIHAVFDCLNCGKHWEDYRTAQDLARKHAIKTGHTVEGDVGYSVRYIPNKTTVTAPGGGKEGG